MNALIAAELERRKALWEEMKRISGGNVPADKVPVSFVRQNDIYHPQAGTYVDQARTLPLTEDGIGATISIRLRGNRYTNYINEDGAKFAYPDTSNRGADRNRVQASKNAQRLNLPIFIIIGDTARKNGRSVYERIELAKVVKYDDSDKSFVVEFINETPIPPSTEEADDFELEESGKVKSARERIGLRQSEFRSSLIEKYGLKCAVCNVRHPDLLDAAHIVAKAERGTDDLRNGIVLCKNHHAAFDNNLFGINPESKKLVFLSKEIKQELNFPQRKLKTATGVLPNIKALRWKWRRFQKVLKEANQ